MINIFSAAEDGWLANSFYFKTPDGIFVIDVQLLTDYAEALLGQIQKEFKNGEVVSVFITHPHPDHYLGLPLFSRRTKAGFHSTKTTAKIIEKTADQELRSLKNTYKRRLPHTFIQPTETFSGRLNIKWKGLTLEFFDVGRSESPSNLVCFIPEERALISGDLIYNRVHPKFGDGSAEAWRQALDKVKGLGVKKVYPGHGPVVGPEIFAHLARYIDHFQMAVEYFCRGKTSLDPDGAQRIYNAMRDKYPDYLLPGNLEKSIESEFARQRGKKVA